jgi:serine protease AprX
MAKEAHGRRAAEVCRRRGLALALLAAGIGAPPAGVAIAGLPSVPGLPPASTPVSLEPSLAAHLRLKGPQAGVPVLVTLRRQVDPAAFAGRPGALHRALRSLAGATQGSLTAVLHTPVRHFWLANALAVRATPAEIAALSAMPAVAAVQLDAPVYRLDAAPADPGGAGWGLDAIRAPAARSAFGVTGRGVLLGSIDTGVDPTRSALDGVVVGWRDFVGGRTTMYDDNGHGTATVLVTAGRGPGVAPGATVLVAKAFDAGGAGARSAVLAAAQWLADPDGDPATADHPLVIDGSWGSQGDNDPWMRQAVRVWRSLGITGIFAAGNAGPGAGTIESPASYPETLAVGALADDGHLAGFSSRGPVVWRDPEGSGPAAGTVLTKPDLVAPGLAIGPDDGTPMPTAGTSLSAAHVAGVAALMTQADPAIGPARLGEILVDTARDLGPAGRDEQYGAGRVDALAAVARVLGVPLPADAGDPAPRIAAVVAWPATPPPARAVLVSGRLAGAPALIRAELRPRLGGRRLGPRAAVVLRAARPGRFRLLLRLRGPTAGRYRLVVRALRMSRRAAGRPVIRQVSFAPSSSRRRVRQ